MQGLESSASCQGRAPGLFLDRQTRSRDSPRSQPAVFSGSRTLLQHDCGRSDSRLRRRTTRPRHARAVRTASRRFPRSNRECKTSSSPFRPASRAPKSLAERRLSSASPRPVCSGRSRRSLHCPPPLSPLALPATGFRHKLRLAPSFPRPNLDASIWTLSSRTAGDSAQRGSDGHRGGERGLLRAG